MTPVMSTKDAIELMLAFGALIIAILGFNQKK
ncbi:MAG TPA: putative holin-like toxin [Bacillus sp. (in: firmicutes)]|nr:putative holin-like toxin [Bacillus sp. (in: firmicutes)]